jgi:hypothetical protein
VVPLAQETVRQGYLDAGRPDLYKPDIVRYFSDEQFATVTAVAGIFVREKPATNLYFGSFYAESLILAETGFQTGAIQIAGTGNIHQLPFFVVACDTPRRWSFASPLLWDRTAPGGDLGADSSPWSRSWWGDTWSPSA